MSTDLQQFLAVAIPSICMLSLPVAVVSGASVFRSFLTATVIYLGICFMNYLGF